MEEEPQPSTATNHQPPPPSPPERITQLQCMSSNSELQYFFLQGLNESFKYLPGILGIVEWRLSVGVGKAHPGDLLQNIRYKSDRLGKVKLIYLLLTVILPYFKKKVYAFVLHNPEGWKEKVLQIFNLFDKVFLAANLINLSIFIKNGQYRCLSQRILKLPMEFINGESARVLNFSLMNRRLVWTVYELFLKTVLPFANNLVGPTLKNIFYLNSYLEVESNLSSNCLVCEDKVRLPMKASCGHFCCYYCYSTGYGEREGDERCRKCGVSVGKWEKLF